jgi:hypothetical protein
MRFWEKESGEWTVENDGMRWAAVMGSKNMNAFGDNFFYLIDKHTICFLEKLNILFIKNTYFIYHIVLNQLIFFDK